MGGFCSSRLHASADEGSCQKYEAGVAAPAAEARVDEDLKAGLSSPDPGVKLRSSITLVQRMGRGVISRWSEDHRLSFELANALEAIEEAEGVRVAEFLSILGLNGHVDAAAVEQVNGNQSAGGGMLSQHSLAHLLPASGAEEMRLDWPLSEVAVLRLLEGFSRGERLAPTCVHQLLEAEVALLGALPNVPDVQSDGDATLTVVGDLHGQLVDLLHTFRSQGFPSTRAAFLFNGDFVDRGEHGVEIVLTLFAFHQLMPSHVFLNRGNHEESSVCGVHGFRQECLRKYGETSYRLFLAAFGRLPLATRCNGRILVVHGGVSDDINLADMQSVDRSGYVIQTGAVAGAPGLRRPGLSRPGGPPPSNVGSRPRVDEVSCKRISSMLWNDPRPKPFTGVSPNTSRGIGEYFGHDVFSRFLSRHPGLELVIRSHEQVGEGYHWPFGEGGRLLTLFSASNYGGKIRNKGAVAIVTFGTTDGKAGAPLGGTSRARQTEPPANVQPSPSWFWEAVDTSAPPTSSSLAAERKPVHAAKSRARLSLIPGSLRGGRAISHGHHEYRLKAGGWLRLVQFEARAIANASVPAHNAHALATLIFEKRTDLAAAYATADTEGTGTLEISTWARETQRVLKLWVPLRRLFAYVLDEQRHAGVAEGRIQHTAFLSRFALRCPALASLYSMRHCLLALLTNEDTAGTGEVRMAAFEEHCRTLHEHFPAEADLCERPTNLIAACGAAAKGWVEGNRVILADLEGCFAITELC
jgi:diadenosine tetraphosphatase ApaH/serine/threonine PP2A family protein phosphatase/sulfur carrier protein ThiS